MQLEDLRNQVVSQNFGLICFKWYSKTIVSIFKDISIGIGITDENLNSSFAKYASKNPLCVKLLLTLEFSDANLPFKLPSGLENQIQYSLTRHCKNLEHYNQFLINSLNFQKYLTLNYLVW